MMKYMNILMKKNLMAHTVEEILKNFESTGKNFDKKIAWEILLIKKLHGKTPDPQNSPFKPEAGYRKNGTTMEGKESLSKKLSV